MAARRPFFPVAPRLNAIARQKHRKHAILEELAAEEDDDMASGISYVDVQLTNDQIKALPTTAITLVAAPGAGQMLLLHAAYLLGDTAAGDYTNLADFASLAVTYAGGSPVASQYIAKDSGASINDLGQLLTGAATAIHLLPFI